ncbi:MAG: SdrD B-like domain-containing protein [Kiritimatiellia bacterium]|jgi:uncharacterized repeat protein (TIGR01451 family)
MDENVQIQMEAIKTHSIFSWKFSSGLTFRRAAFSACRRLTSGSLAAGLLLAAGALSVEAITITRTSGDVLQTDIPTGLSCAYVSYIISNDTAVAYSNIWVQAGSFTGNIVSLAGGDSGMCHVDDLPPGAHKAVYFFLGATTTTTQPQSHAIKVYEGYPAGGALVASQTFALTVAPTGENNSSKVHTVTYGPNPPTVGGMVMVKVTGDAGNVKKGDLVNFSPAVFDTWNAGAFQLCDATLALTNKNGQARTVSDHLQLPADDVDWSGGKLTYTACYTFKALVETAQSTPVSPMTYATQNSKSSHPKTDGYQYFLPIQSPVNTTVLAKLANVTRAYTNEIVTYTVRFTNSGTNDVAIDRVVDSLPPHMAYLPGSSRLNGVAMLDPYISGTQLVWSETELIPASSSRDFTFQARALIAGLTTNSVIAYVGGTSTVIDTTLSTSDNVPGEAIVRTLLPPTATDDNISLAEDSVWARPAPGVLNNDGDLNGFDIAVVAHTQPAHGTLVLNADGSYVYAPDANYHGGDSFTYTITNFNGRADTATVHVTVLPVNDAPSFTPGADQTVPVNAGAQTVAGWAADISKGPANESWQSLTFNVANDNAALFSVPPSISADGTLTYTPAPGMSGIATVTVHLQDDGGRANGGEDRSAGYTFTINVIGYSIGNRVFKDFNNDGVHDFADAGIAGVRMALFAATGGLPSGSALQTTVTDDLGFYRFDHLAAGSYVVVVDVAASSSLAGLISSTGHDSSVALAGDLLDHGIDTPVSVGGIVGGIASHPVAVGEGLQPLGELVNLSSDAGRRGPCGDACDNLVVDFGFTPLYSIGNRVFSDDNYNGCQDDNEGGVEGVPLYAFAAGEDGLPTGEPLAHAVTDAGGWYRLDGLVIGTYVVVLDREAGVAADPSLASYTSSIGGTNDMTLAGDRQDHGWYFPRINIGPVTNGMASSPVTLGPDMQPLGEQTSGADGAGSQSPYGDDRDNLVLDFGLVRTYCIGNRIFLDDGSGGGTANDGIQNGAEPGISNVAVRVFAADANGNATGDALVIGVDNLTAALTDPDGWYRLFRLAPGDYVVVVDVGLSTNLTGFVFKDGSTWVDSDAASTSLVGLVSSSGCSDDFTLSGDRRDHGKDEPFSLGVVQYGIASAKITLGPGLQPLGEETNSLVGASSHAPSGDAYDNLVVDFGFAPTFSIGNRVFWDNGAGGGTAGNGRRDGGEPGIAGVLVDVRTNGTTVASTVTDVDGYYRFDNLLPGEYTVFLPPANFALSGMLAGMLSSTNTIAGENGDKGVDDNHPAVNGIASGKVTIGFGAQPAGETDIGAGAGANGPFGDNYDNLTIDFGMIEVNSVNCSVGSLVWNDANNNGRYDAGESGIAGVTLEIWKVDLNGDLVGTAPHDTTITSSTTNGIYLFDNLVPGDYRIRIPAEMFDVGQPLEALNTASTLHSATDDQIDNDSNGAQSAAGQEVWSPVFHLHRGGEPQDDTGEPREFGPGATLDNHSPRLDDNGDMTIDFGFYAPTLEQTNLVSLGSLVWSDLNNNGVWDAGEPGIPDVTLELYITNATGLVYWGTTQSASDGTYFFHDLMNNTNWVVRIPASNFEPDGALYGTPISGGMPVNADNQVDGDNNALQPGGFGAEVWSPVVALTAGTEPTNESGLGGGQDLASPYVDANGDMTVDFGFTPVYSLGNRVFADLDNNGVMDAAESGVGGVPLKLFAADADGAPTGAVLAATATDADGWYRFDDLIAGAYVVVADVANANALAHWVSSTGVSNDVSLNGDRKDHGRDMPVSVGAVVNGIASVAATLGPDTPVEGEATGEGAGANSPHGDARDNLTLDFGFTPTYSIGNWIFKDNANTGISCIESLCTCGFSNVVVKLFAADVNGAPTGAALASRITCCEGYYRFDGLLPGTYVVVVDQASSPELAHYRSSTGVTDETGLGADLHDNGLDAPLGAESAVPGGIASRPVTVGHGLQPVGEVEGNMELGGFGPLGDAYDNLTVDFGFHPLYSLGNRVFFDNGDGGGTVNDGIQNGGEPGVAHVAMKLFAADSGGNPTGDVAAATTTDASGWYRFDGLEAGRYVVVVDVGSSPSLAGQVSSTGASSDTTLAGDGRDHGHDTPVSVGTVVNGIASVAVALGVNEIVLPTGETVDAGEGAGAHGANGDAADNLTLDFGFTAAAGVSGGVFEDVNANGAFDAEDTNRLAGVTVNLTTPCGVVLATTTTDSLGGYAFADLAPGDYAVVIVGLPGWYATGDDDGGADRRVAVTLASGENETGVDFLEARLGTIGGAVWNDLDADGDFDEVDLTLGLAGVTVSLETNGVTVATTTTMVDGRYFFMSVPPGRYDVVQTDLPGWTSTMDSDGGDPNRIAVLLPSGGQSLGNNFLDYTCATISGKVLVDVNGDGLVDHNDTVGLAGVTVRLLDAGDTDVLGSPTVTGADGSFSFAGLKPGAYTLVETDPAGYISSTPDQLSVTVTSGQESGGHVFLDALPGNIGDFVWEDLNGNGVQDPDEPGISNVVVRLTDIEGNEISTNVTDAVGFYAFSNLAARVYYVQALSPAGCTSTVARASADTAADSDGNEAGWSWPVQVGSGENRTDVDFGLYRPIALGSRVWNDLDEDGIQDPGEPGMADIAVSLYSVSEGETNLVERTTTDASGNYSFLAAPGDYVLRVDPPDGYAFSPKHAGGSTSDTDSDFGTNHPYSALFTVASGDTLPNVDAGLYSSPTLSVITSFRAYAEDGTVFVEWETAAEYDTQGYWIDRLEGGVWARLNPDELVHAEMNGHPTTYTLADPGATPGGRYSWRVVEIEGSGRENIHGPYTVTVDGAAADYDAWANGIDWAGAASGRDDDPDGDGLANFEEYLAGTDPLQANSVLKILGIRPVSTGIEIFWASVPGKVYAVEHAPRLGDPWLPVKTGIVAEGPVSRFVLPGADGGFFRVVLTAEPSRSLCGE